LSMLYNGFWCRYLCPYGALLGLFSWMSPIKVRRDENLCVDCSLCDKACPARLPVSNKKAIMSVECIGCHDCVTSCPVPGALLMGTKKRIFNPKKLAIGIVALFIIGYSAARIGGLWENELSDDEIRHHVARMHSDDYTHPGR
ncbi:4Fe-4S binding protein, partial [bacterium]|nr:4Fe-4S binding protein [bacterium]